jgi:hypothetical protein
LGVPVVQSTKVADMTDKRFREAVDKELADFERREREFMAQERRERANQLGLAAFFSSSIEGGS